MLLPISELYRYWLLRPEGVVHVGAHLAEESEAYIKFGFGPVVWVEAQKSLADHLAKSLKPGDSVVCALVWSEEGIKKSFNLTSNSQSSSVFDFGTHQKDHPDVTLTDRIELVTSTLHNVLPRDCSADMLVLDIQGAEYQAIVGLADRITDFKWIYCEVNRAQVYVGIEQVGALDSLLSSHGFVRLATVWTFANWGDALYARVDWAEHAYGGKLFMRARIVGFELITSIRSSYLYKGLKELWKILRTSRSKSQSQR